MTHAFPRTATLAAGLLVASVAAHAAITIDTHVIVPPGETYGLPPGQSLLITDTGILDAAPAVSGTAIGIAGEVLNQGILRAALGSEINGLNISGRVRSSGRIEASTLSVSGRLENLAAGRVDAGAYPYFPDQGVATQLSGGALIPRLGFSVSDNGTVHNAGRWLSWGAADIRGSFVNHGSFESLNNPLTIPAAVAPYTQLLRIGHPFLGQPTGVLRNAAEGTMRLGPQTLLVNEGLIENHGVLQLDGAIVQTGTWGALHNAAGGRWTLDQGATVRLEPMSTQAFVNDGRFDVVRGSLDNQSPLAATWIGTTGELRVGALGQVLHGQGFIDNAGLVQVDGLLTARFIDNRGGTVAVGTTGSVEVEELWQNDGRLTIDGSFAGRVALFGGVLDGQGRINGDVFVGGLGDPALAPCSAFGLACFRPGNSPDSFEVAGEVSFGDGGVLELELASDGQGGVLADFLLASSVRFDAGSAIVVRLGVGLGGLTQDLELLRCTLGCSFADGVTAEVVGGQGVLRFVDGALVLSAVPEPAVWSLMLLGVALVRRHALRRVGETAGVHPAALRGTLHAA